MTKLYNKGTHQTHSTLARATRVKKKKYYLSVLVGRGSIITIIFAFPPLLPPLSPMHGWAVITVVVLMLLELVVLYVVGTQREREHCYNCRSGSVVVTAPLLFSPIRASQVRK